MIQSNQSLYIHLSDNHAWPEKKIAKFENKIWQVDINQKIVIKHKFVWMKKVVMILRNTQERWKCLNCKFCDQLTRVIFCNILVNFDHVLIYGGEIRAKVTQEKNIELGFWFNFCGT